LWIASTIASLALNAACAALEECDISRWSTTKKGLAAAHDVTYDLVVGVERSKGRVALTQPTRKRSAGVDVEGGVASGRRR
jgi:hypothetical protein